MRLYYAYNGSDTKGDAMTVKVQNTLRRLSYIVLCDIASGYDDNDAKAQAVALFSMASKAVPA